MSSQQQSPKLSIILAIIAAIAGLGVALFDNWDKLVSRPGEPENPGISSDTQRVKFILLDSSGNPISLARVQFIFDGAPEPRFTDDLGYVSISIPRSEEVRVSIQKEGFKPIRRAINLNADKDTTAEYVMEVNSVIQPDASGNLPKETFEESKEIQESSDVSERDNSLEEASLSRSNAIEPLAFFDLYFYRVDNGLYTEAFQMLSQDYMETIYFNRGYSTQSALENFRIFWDRCDMEHKDKRVVFAGEEATIFYQRRFFCKDDNTVGRTYEFQSQKMVLIKSSDEHGWKVKEVVAAQ
jgi:hypothetical protein